MRSRARRRRRARRSRARSPAPASWARAGNSGVILSQLVRGAMEALADERTISRAALARRLRTPATRPCASRRRGRSSPSRASWPSAPRRSTRLPLAGGAGRARRARGGRARADAGAARRSCARPAWSTRAAPGSSSSCAGSRLTSAASRCPTRGRAQASLPLEPVHQELSRFRYCTSFFVEGENVDPERARARAGRVRRLAARRRLARGREGARPHGRARARARARDRARASSRRST